MLKKIKSISLVEVFLVLFFIILVTGILYFIGNNLASNVFLYNGLVIALIIFTIIVASIATFQFIKGKYVEAVKAEVKEEIEQSRTKLGNKIAETNNRMAYFEANYSKKLKKIMKDYSVKVKEIEDIKKELNGKLGELDRKAAQLEIETCIIKAEKHKGKAEIDVEQVKTLYARIIELSERYPGICAEEILVSINSEE